VPFGVHIESGEPLDALLLLPDAMGRSGSNLCASVQTHHWLPCKVCEAGVWHAVHQAAATLGANLGIVARSDRSSLSKAQPFSSRPEITPAWCASWLWLARNHRIRAACHPWPRGPACDYSEVFVQMASVSRVSIIEYKLHMEYCSSFASRELVCPLEPNRYMARYDLNAFSSFRRRHKSA
jgi:hypothetical protein